MHFWDDLMGLDLNPIGLRIKTEEAKEHRFHVFGACPKCRCYDTASLHRFQDQRVLVMLGSVDRLLLESCCIAEVFLGPDLDFAAFYDLCSLCAEIRDDITHERIALCISVKIEPKVSPPIPMLFDRIILGINAQKRWMDLQGLYEMAAA